MYRTLVTSEILSQHLDDPAWVVADCRFDLAQPEYGGAAYSAGHIPGAVYADLNRHLSSTPTAKSGRHPLPDPQVFAQQLGQWGIDRQTQVVVYDAGAGGIAVRLWWMLRWLGHEAAALLDGGLATWQAEGRPMSSHPHTIEASKYHPVLQDGVCVSMAQVRDGLRGGEMVVVDARAAARYRGEVEPIDPVAGHIPTARNFPFEGNLDPQGRFLPPEQLRLRFADLAAAPERVVHMCGSGVTACHNLLAMEIAGYTGSKLYPGSWSEWVRDTQNPVVTGDDA